MSMIWTHIQTLTAANLVKTCLFYGTEKLLLYFHWVLLYFRWITIYTITFSKRYFNDVY
jgi:hypothetical protein